MHNNNLRLVGVAAFWRLCLRWVAGRLWAILQADPKGQVAVLCSCGPIPLIYRLNKCGVLGFRGRRSLVNGCGESAFVGGIVMFLSDCFWALVGFGWLGVLLLCQRPPSPIYRFNGRFNLQLME